MLAGYEGMLQCVEEACMAVGQADDEVHDLWETVAVMQHHQHMMLSALPGKEPAGLAWLMPRATDFMVSLLL